MGNDLLEKHFAIEAYRNPEKYLIVSTDPNSKETENLKLQLEGFLHYENDHRKGVLVALMKNNVIMFQSGNTNLLPEIIRLKDLILNYDLKNSNNYLNFRIRNSIYKLN